MIQEDRSEERNGITIGTLLIWYRKYRISTGKPLWCHQWLFSFIGIVFIYGLIFLFKDMQMLDRSYLNHGVFLAEIVHSYDTRNYYY